MWSIKNEEDLFLYKENLIDRFGPLPVEIINLFTIFHIKVLSIKAFIVELIIKDFKIVYKFSDIINPLILTDYVKNNLTSTKLSPDKILVINKKFENIDHSIKYVIHFIKSYNAGLEIT